MTLRALEAQAQHLRRLNGERCIRAGIGGASALLLDFNLLNEPDETGYRLPELYLVASCPWRIETSENVIVGYFDRDEVLPDRVQICVGQTISSASVVLPSYTVRVTFSSDLTIWIFPCDSEDYALYGEYPSSPWYVGGRAVPSSWED
jgi:hypothetical protein